MQAVTQLGALLVAASSPASPDCSYDKASIAALSVEEFDSDMTGGWRKLEARGCQLAAAEVIKAYRQDGKALPAADRSLLVWHEGQLRAIVGDYKRAIPLLMGGVPENDSADFADYALGTVAFLQRDKTGLEAARARLATMPRPSDFPTSYTVKSGDKVTKIPIAWPLNLDVLDGLIKCFNMPYKVAYNCRTGVSK